MDTDTRPLILARQPIFDSDLKVWGYELLFRDPTGEQLDGDMMTARVLLRAGLDVGIEGLVGTKKASVNVTRPYVLGEREVPLPPDQTVLEILPTIERDDELTEGARRLNAEGFLIALDDYLYRPGDEKLLELVNLIKIDVLSAGVEGLARQVELCSRFGAYLVAEKVETIEQLEACRNLGFHMFQGHFISRPVDIGGRTLNPSRLTCLRLMQRLCDPDMSAREAEEMISTDPALAVRFLRAAGSGAAGGLRRKITSIREGAVLLGQRRLRAWVMLMLLSEQAEVSSDRFPMAMVRARMCELIAERIRPELSAAAFTVGLISALGSVMGASVEEMVDSLNLDDELVEALRHGSGRLGHILSDALAMEMGEVHLFRCGLGMAQLEEISVQAVYWGNQVSALAESA